ncbi:MAG TPA: flagellar basal body P-ring formation chaperone FlgA [Syntrophorhabdaceae bacterium]|nr:flagellar basal body P-ring formation chaperone FlgA [Syntrophorhabdaceae bacterium]
METEDRNSKIANRVPAVLEDGFGRTDGLTWIYVMGLLFIASLLFFAIAHAREYSLLETKIVQFVAQLYGEDADVEIRLNNVSIANQLKDREKVGNMSFLKVPDAEGQGICAVEIEGAGGKLRSLHVPFRVLIKRKLFVLKQDGKMGEIIGKNDITVKETYLSGKGTEYPSLIDDVIGRALKKDASMNTVITSQLLEDPVIIQRGEIVNLIAENRDILVQTKGKTMAKGKMGDLIRVQNVTSGKEVQGRVTANNTVTVEF